VSTRPYALRVRYHFASGNVFVARAVTFATEQAMLTALPARLAAAVASAPSARRIDAVIDGPTIPGLAGDLVDVDGNRVDFMTWIDEQGAKAQAVLEAMGR
jgi:hypothetical protein